MTVYGQGVQIIIMLLLARQIIQWQLCAVDFIASSLVYDAAVKLMHRTSSCVLLWDIVSSFFLEIWLPCLILWGEGGGGQIRKQNVVYTLQIVHAAKSILLEALMQ